MSVSKVDVYLRIKHHFEYLIRKGAYLPGEALPSVRQVSLEMGVNPNTVQKAYQMLTDEKLIDIIPKKGAFIAQHHHPLTEPLKEELSHLMSTLQKYHTDQEILEMIKHILRGIKHD